MGIKVVRALLITDLDEKYGFNFFADYDQTEKDLLKKATALYQAECEDRMIYPRPVVDFIIEAGL